MQLNEAMFVGTPGWVLKPSNMRGFAEDRPRRVKFLGHIYGVSTRTQLCVRVILG